MANKDNDESVDLKQQIENYKKLLEEPDFENLETELRKPNIFSILGISRKETQHSNFLAWLLDPNASHGLGNRFLIRVLRDLSVEANRLDILNINNLNFSDVEVYREVPINTEGKGGFIDILIIFRDENDKLVICIENKIDTTDSDGQLTKYREYVEDTFKEEGDEGYNNIFIYLTPKGANSNNTYEIKWSNYSYEKIIKHLESIQNSITDSTIKTYISDYLTTLNSEIMSTNNSATDLANKIFKANPDLFKFVFDYKSNELYKMDWGKYNWVITYAEKLMKLLKQVDDKIESELGFTKNYISIRRDNQICYEFYSRETKPNCSMEFAFDKKRKDCVDLINQRLLDINPLKSGQYLKRNKYFAIPNVNEFIDQYSDVLQEIHKLRFPNS